MEVNNSCLIITFDRIYVNHNECIVDVCRQNPKFAFSGSICYSFAPYPLAGLVLCALCKFSCLLKSTCQPFQRLLFKQVADIEFVKNFTPPDFRAKNFTPSISPNFNSFSKKTHKKMSENGEIYTAGKNFTLPPAVMAVTNSTSAAKRFGIML